MLVQAGAIVGALVGIAGIVVGAPSGCSADTFGRCGSRVRPSQPVGRWDTAIALMRLPG